MSNDFAADGIWTAEADWDLGEQAEGEDVEHVLVPTLAVVGRPNVASRPW